MDALEFRTRIKNGVIHIPDKFKDVSDDYVKVIVIRDKKRPKSVDIIEKLLANPIELKDFSPIARNEIYDRI